MRATIIRSLVCAALVLATACGGKAVFRLSSDDNNPLALEQALARRHLPASPKPINAAHQPRVFVVQGGATKQILAYDLAAARLLWRTDADVQSRISVGGDFIVLLEGGRVAGRDQQTGAPRWKAGAVGTPVAVAADAERAYVVSKDGNKWWLAAIDGRSGDMLWKSDAAGQLGAPAAHGGVVYVPFLNQWLSIVDGRTGEQMTRVRGIDEQISMLDVTSQTAYYGSKHGVFRLDAHSASGKRADATYGQFSVPPQLERTTYGRDAYDPVQNTYSAADRARMLWSAEPSTSGPMKLAGDTFAVHYFRYVFGFSATGELRWAFNHPRVELVSSDHTGSVIVAVSAAGDIVALDPHSGAVRARANTGATGPVLGATFDADGWSPAGPPEPIDTRATLVAMFRDRDARFVGVKELAATAVAAQPGAEATSDLLGVLGDDRAPDRLKEVVVNLLIKRKDPASLPVLAAQLALHSDYIARTEPVALGAVAKAIAGLGSLTIDPKQQEAAVVALQSHLDAAATPSPDLVQVIAAIAALGGNTARMALASHLWLYHADDDLGGNPAWQKAIVEALSSATGGPAERAVLRQVADDPRSEPGLVATIRAALD
ncbi:MAG: PQQ-binding-like beta-propeller repeat protein [Kofleriaceae bacterium]